MSVVPNDATRAQIDAARPDASTWLTANAGSGKTRVLTDRVARLLLSGVEPQQILCLTYTKAAASEMQNRLFKRLGEWAMLKDDPLRASLQELGLEEEVSADALRAARTLFARAIETPGGLKIQTIHSFCAAILRRFPLEAGVSPQFSEIEDRAADLLREEIVDEMADGPDAARVAGVVQHYTGDDFAALTRDIIAKREAFFPPKALGDFLTLAGLPADLTAARIEAAVFQGDEQELIAEMIPHLTAKGGTDAKAAAKLGAFTGPTFDMLPLLESVFLTSKNAKEPFSAKIGAFPTKPTQAKIAHLMPQLHAFMQRVEEAREARLVLNTAQKSTTLHDFARDFITRYEAEKQARGWLDFDDLILKTRALLNDAAVATWVLYRIDGGIDHILVDEAQDTSPRQWEVIERLTEEFYSGSGTRPGVARTLFVVGDKKQSIYSFQGADPEALDHKAEAFRARTLAAGQLFQHRSLEYSFRSSGAILRTVDQTFDPRILRGFDKESQHKPFKTDLPGRVDLWPVVENAEVEEDPPPWTDPVDRRSAHHHTVILAERIAGQIRELTDSPHFIPADGKESGTFVRRPIRAGDFLILVQRRGPLFAEIIRACKAAGLPIAGADRLKVGAELAVKDLAAMLSFLSTPEDDLSLATALKSPLFGWSEQALFSLAEGRGKAGLWEVLRNQHRTHPETLGVLEDLRGQVDFLRPYDLIERILTRHGGRARLLARLGPEAEDGINAMLSQALSYERTDVPSLTGFLHWMETDDLEIKRQVDNSSDQIRVMSVHGAKGLEAPIVILPDTGRRNITVNDSIVEQDGVAIWKPNVDEMPAHVAARVDAMKDAQARERLRLLYVAMTRAEKWLIVAAAGGLNKDGDDWYQIIESAMGHLGSVDLGDDGGRRYEEGDWDRFPIAETDVKNTEPTVLEPVFGQHVTARDTPSKTLSPSDLGGAKALPGDAGAESDEAKAYGSLVHLLLENLAGLPSATRPDAARHLRTDLNSDSFDRAHAEAAAVLDDSQLADVFAPGTIAEIPVTGRIGPERFHCVIDRLSVRDGKVRAVDFKTNRVVPETPADCPEGLCRQMGAYANLLGQIYPTHEIEVAILWTATRKLMVLPPDIVASALWSSPHLDGAGDAP